MPVIALVATKGGVGKTTAAIGLAAAAVRAGHAAYVIDADPQGTALDWQRFAQQRDDVAPEVRHAEAVNDLDRSAWVFIDTPPAAALSRYARDGIKAADLVLIPASPTPADVLRIRPTREAVAELTDAPAVVLLTRVRGGTRAPDEAREGLSGHQDVLTASVPLREAIAQAMGSTPPAVMVDVYALVLEELADRLQGLELASAAAR